MSVQTHAGGPAPAVVRRGLPTRRAESGAGGVLWSERLAQVYVALAIIVEFGALPITPHIGYAMAGMAALTVCGSPLERIRSIPVSASVLALLGWLVASVAWSDQLEGSLKVILVHDTIPLVFLVPVLGVLTVRRTTDAMVWTIRFIIVVSILALLLRPETRQLASSDPFSEPLKGWRAMFGHKNGLAVFLPFGVGTILVFDRARWARRATLLGLAVLTAGSGSVTGIAAVLCITFGYVWFRSQLMQRRAFVVTSLSVAAAAVATLSLWLLSLPSETLANTRIAGKDVTLTGRSYIWRATWRAIVERPLQGFGIGGIMNTDAASARTAQIWGEVNWQVPHAHNSVLDLWVQAGLVGLVLYLLVLIPTVVRAVRNLRVHPAIAEWTLLWAAGIAIFSVTEAAFLRGGLLGLLIAHSFLQRPADDPDL